MRRISRNKARKIWDQHQDLILTASKIAPDSIFAARINSGDCPSVAFDVMENEFHYYNCDKERGRRVFFWVDN